MPAATRSSHSTAAAAAADAGGDAGGSSGKTGSGGAASGGEPLSVVASGFVRLMGELRRCRWQPLLYVYAPCSKAAASQGGDGTRVGMQIVLCMPLAANWTLWTNRHSRA